MASALKLKVSHAAPGKHSLKLKTIFHVLIELARKLKDSETMYAAGKHFVGFTDQ